MLSLSQVWATQKSDPATDHRGALTVRFHLQSSVLTNSVHCPQKYQWLKPICQGAALRAPGSEHPGKGHSVSSTPGPEPQIIPAAKKVPNSSNSSTPLVCLNSKLLPCTKKSQFHRLLIVISICVMTSGALTGM